MKSKETLCWTCERAAGGKGCPWAAYAEPVDGWVAVETRIVSNESCEESYMVFDCPLYQIDRRLIGKACKMCKLKKSCKHRGHVCSNFQEVDVGVEELFRRLKESERKAGGAY